MYRRAAGYLPICRALFRRHRGLLRRLGYRCLAGLAVNELALLEMQKVYLDLYRSARGSFEVVCHDGLDRLVDAKI